MKTSTFSSLIVIFLLIAAGGLLSGCGKKGSPLPPADCNDNSFPATSAGVPGTSCPPQKFPGTYPPEE